MEILKLLILLFVIFIIYKFFYNTESFSRIYGKFCRQEDCKNKTFGQCLDCFNCGFCLEDENKGVCVPGNIYGPTNKNKKCMKYIHNDEFYTNFNNYIKIN